MTDDRRAHPESSSLTFKAEPFHWRAVNAYLFDIDGTLLNATGLVHYQALNRAMAVAYGSNTTIDGVLYHGKTDVGILRAALEGVGITGAEFESRLPQALEIVRQEVKANAATLAPKLCTGIPEVLGKLQRAGKVLGVASGNLEVVGWHKVEAAGLRQFFSFGCFADHCEMREQVFRNAIEEARRRVGPEVRICFVGDTPTDIEAARHVEAHVIAVATGIYKVDELSTYGPDVCVGSCAECWKEWVPRSKISRVKT